jgi:hypothetical protein
LEAAQERLGEAERRKRIRWHEELCSSTSCRAFMLAAKDKCLDVRLPARQWGERVD